MLKKVLAGLLATAVVTVTGVLLYGYWTSNSGPFQFFENAPGEGSAKWRGIAIIDHFMGQKPGEQKAEQYLSRAGFLCMVVDRSESEGTEAWSMYESLFASKLTRMLKCSYRYGLPGSWGNIWYVDAFFDATGIVRGHIQNTQCGFCI